MVDHLCPCRDKFYRSLRRAYGDKSPLLTFGCTMSEGDRPVPNRHYTCARLSGSLDHVGPRLLIHNTPGRVEAFKCLLYSQHLGALLSRFEGEPRVSFREFYDDAVLQGLQLPSLIWARAGFPNRNCPRGYVEGEDLKIKSAWVSDFKDVGGQSIGKDCKLSEHKWQEERLHDSNVVRNDGSRGCFCEGSLGEVVRLVVLVALQWMCVVGTG